MARPDPQRRPQLPDNPPPAPLAADLDRLPGGSPARASGNPSPSAGTAEGATSVQAPLATSAPYFSWKWRLALFVWLTSFGFLLLYELLAGLLRLLTGR